MIETRIERRLNFTQRILIVLMVTVVVVPFLFTWWVSRQYPAVSTVQLNDLVILNDGPLCPGDVLRYTFDLNALGSGLLIRDRTLWQVAPMPKTVIFSDARRFILSEAIDQKLTEAWHVPLRYVNPATDELDTLPPGEYKFRLAVSSPSRSTVTDNQEASFSIRPNCEVK